MGAVRATEHRSAGLEAVADDPAAAMFAFRRQRVDRALEAVEIVRQAAARRQTAPALAHHAFSDGPQPAATMRHFSFFNRVLPAFHALKAPPRRNWSGQPSL